MLAKIFKSIDLRIFIPSVVVMLAAALIMIFAPDTAKTVIDGAFSFLTHDIGWIYLIVVLVLMILSVAIAFSKYGKIVLGDKDETKQYSDFVWTAMIFTSGMSIAVVLLGFMEPINLLSAQLLDAEPMSDRAFEYAHMYAQFFKVQLHGEYMDPLPRLWVILCM